MALLPIQLLFYAFVVVSAVYAWLLIKRYKHNKTKFTQTALDFLLFGDITIGLILVPSIFYTIVGWNDVYLHVVLLILAGGIVAFGCFVYWTIKTYRHEGLKLWGKATLIGTGRAMGTLLLGCLAIFLFFVFLLLLEDLMLYHPSKR